MRPGKCTFMTTVSKNPWLRCHGGVVVWDHVQVLSRLGGPSCETASHQYDGGMSFDLFSGDRWSELTSRRSSLPYSKFVALAAVPQTCRRRRRDGAAPRRLRHQRSVAEVPLLWRPDGRDRQTRFRLPSSVCQSLVSSVIFDNFPNFNSSCDCYTSSCLSLLLACAPFDERHLPGSLLADAWVIVSAMKRAVRVQTCEMHSGNPD